MVNVQEKIGKDTHQHTEKAKQCHSSCQKVLRSLSLLNFRFLWHAICFHLSGWHKLYCVGSAHKQRKLWTSWNWGRWSIIKSLNTLSFYTAISHIRREFNTRGDVLQVIYVKPGCEANLDSLIQDTIRLTTSVKVWTSC